MTSFIEIPQLSFGGIEQPSIYVNTADIITLRSDWQNNTLVEIRDAGTEGMSVTRTTYLPIGMFLDKLAELAKWPGVRSWSDDTKVAFREPAQKRMRTAADKERAATRAGH
jgi:hypothetical protein